MAPPIDDNPGPSAANPNVTTPQQSASQIASIVLPTFTGENYTHYLRIVDHAFKAYNVDNPDIQAHHLMTALPYDKQTSLS